MNKRSKYIRRIIEGICAELNIQPVKSVRVYFKIVENGDIFIHGEYDDVKQQISIFRTGQVSTVLHELAHHWYCLKFPENVIRHGLLIDGVNKGENTSVELKNFEHDKGFGECHTAIKYSYKRVFRWKDRKIFEKTIRIKV